MPTSLGWRQRGPAHGAPGWGNVSENGWGKVSEKLSRYWGNDSEKRQGRKLLPGGWQQWATRATVSADSETVAATVAGTTPNTPFFSLCCPVVHVPRTPLTHLPPPQPPPRPA